MTSLLPIAEAPILRMSGGGMESLLPAAPPVHIAGMHGGGSLLPHAPDVPMIAMRGGGETAASFGITNLSADEKLPDISSCAPMTGTPTPCDILQPFVDRRVQALLKRVNTRGKNKVDIGCGEITREDKRLTISFHEKAITLLSCDLTGTFANFHTGMRRHTPLSVEKSKTDKGAHGLLSWMLGSRVDEKGRFDLITFMERMEKETPVLPLNGFRRFLSYHKEKSEKEEMDVLRHAMELYGYRTGAVEKDVYGLILSPTIAVRRVDTGFSIYTDGVVTSGSWDGSWNSYAGGFAVFEPAVVAKTSASASSPSTSGAATAPSGAASKAAAASSSTSGAVSTASSAATAAASSLSASAAATSAATASKIAAAKAAAEAAAKAAASAKNTGATAKEKENQIAMNGIFEAHLQAQNNSVKTNNGTTESVKQFTGIKNETTVIVNDYHLIDPDINPYYLRGVIHHGGGNNMGHYVYYYRIPEKENEWIRFSDREVGKPTPRSIDPNVDDLNKGYIYLFEREGSSDGVNKGIQNHGNSCWMNAALQMFYHIKEYREYVEGFKNDGPMIPQNIKDMTLALQQIFQRYSTATKPSIECPTEYKTLFKAVFKNKKEGSQEDTMEFITKVLLGIISPPDKTDFVEGDPRSPIYNLFRLDFSSNLSCTNPQDAFSGTPGQMPMLILPVPQHEVPLDTLLHQYSASYPAENNTKVGGHTCTNPQKQIRFDIHPYNKYTILQLSRFT